jgi:hypothetical protein
MGMEEVGCGRAVHEGGGGREDWHVRRGTVRREIVVKVGTKQQGGRLAVEDDANSLVQPQNLFESLNSKQAGLALLQTLHENQ